MKTRSRGAGSPWGGGAGIGLLHSHVRCAKGGAGTHGHPRGVGEGEQLGLVPVRGFGAGVGVRKPCGCPCPSRLLGALGAVLYWLSLGSPHAKCCQCGCTEGAWSLPGRSPCAGMWGQRQPLPRPSSPCSGTAGLSVSAGLDGRERGCRESALI